MSGERTTPGNTPTGAFWDALVGETFWAFAHGDISKTEAEQRFHSLLSMREQHDRHVTRARDEREPELADLIAEREGR